MTPTREQWQQIEQALGNVLGRVSLTCDGYTVDAIVNAHKMKLVIAIYVNGVLEGKWTNGEGEIPRKFCQERKHFAYSAKMRASMVRLSKFKGFPKEERAAHAADAKKTFSSWSPWWTNAAALCRHLRKTCASIEIVKIGY